MEDTGTATATSSGPPGPLSTYTIRHRSDRSTSSNNISPAASSGISETARPQDTAHRRPTFEHRPYSDYGLMYRKIKVDTIAEDVARKSTITMEAIRNKPLPTRSLDPRNTTTPPSASSKSSGSLAFDTHRRGPLSEPSEYTSLSRSPARPVPGHNWSRTKSGSVWYERLRTSPEESRDNLLASAGKIPSLKGLTPLLPPRSPPDQSAPSDGHVVRVEKSFTKLQEDEPLSDTSPPTSRKSSINPRRIFSASLQMVRRFSFNKHKRRMGSVRSISPLSLPRNQHLPDHMTLLKRNRTSEALRRVNSILQETSLLSDATSPVSVVNRLHARTMSDKSNSSRGSSALKGKNRISARVRSPEIRYESDESLQDVVEGISYTSSQLALRMGAQPNNTPDERATYKIKKSPSVETEEFLKVDISIRGGTSYLPSEARRIHTPPLPQEGLDGKKRGFFFDYNAPKGPETRQNETLDPSRIPARNTSRVSSSGKKSFVTADGHVVSKAKTSDWYEAKLAQLEESEEDGLIMVSSGRGLNLDTNSKRFRSGTQTSLSEIRKRKDEEKLDMTIPEHLPSSPLCPRHPRYWRIVKGRGSQFRGCWMHGVGVWNDDINFL